MDNKPRYCGIDPSSKTGFLLLDSKGKVLYENEFKSKKTDPQRMIDIWLQVKQHLNPMTDTVLIEGFSYGSKGRGVSFQYGIGWIIRAFLHLEGFSYIEVTPSQLKKFACNNGRAKKEVLIDPIKKKWGFLGMTDNTTDAYVLARIGYSMTNQQGLLIYEKKIVEDLIKSQIK